MLYKRLFCIVLGIFILFSLLAQDEKADSTFIQQEVDGRVFISHPDTSNSSTIILQEVVVNAYQVNTRLMQVPGSISLISGKDVSTADGNNLSNTLHSIPGVYMHSGTYATSRIIIRGVGSRTPYNTNRIKSYLNDIPLTSSDGISTPEDIDLSGIGRIEIIKGPASALYGSGLGGSINIYTHSPIKSRKGILKKHDATIKSRKGTLNKHKVHNSTDKTDNTGNTGITNNTGNTGITNNTGNTGITNNTGNTDITNNTRNTGNTGNTRNTGNTNNTDITNNTRNTRNTGNTGSSDITDITDINSDQYLNVNYNSTVNPIAGSALIQYGEFNTLKGVLGLNYYQHDLGITANISHLQSDGYRQNNHIKRTSLISAGQWRQNNYSLEYTLLLTDMNAGIPSSIGKTLYETNPTSAAVNWKEAGGFKDYQIGLGGLTIDNNLSSEWNNRLTVFGRWVDSYEKRPFNNLDDSSVGGGVRNKLTFHTSKVDLLLGLEWIADKYRWQMDLNNDLINKNAEVRNHLNIFGMAYYRPAPKWNISFGGAINSIRYRLTDEFPNDGDSSGKRNFPVIFSPRMGANYMLNNEIAFYASIGHGFSMPSPEETLLPEGNINENIKPEQGIQYEAGVRFDLFKNTTRIEISTYLINLNNLLVTKRFTEDIFTGINAGKTRHSGIEIMLNQQIFRRSSFPIEPLELYIQTQKVSSQYMNDANTVKSDGYIVNNIKLTYNVQLRRLGTISLFSSINNVFNEHYAPMITVNAVAFGNAEPRYYYPGMPRHWSSGLSWNF